MVYNYFQDKNTSSQSFYAGKHFILSWNKIVFKNFCINIVKNHLNIISNRTIWLIDGTLTGTSTPGQSIPGSNSNKGVTPNYPDPQIWNLTTGCKLVSRYPFYFFLGEEESNSHLQGMHPAYSRLCCQNIVGQYLTSRLISLLFFGYLILVTLYRDVFVLKDFHNELIWININMLYCCCCWWPLIEDDQKAPFSIATTPRYKGGSYSFLWIAPLYPWVLSKEVSSTILKVFGMTRPGIEPRSPGLLANTLPTRPISQLLYVV